MKPGKKSDSPWVKGIIRAMGTIVLGLGAAGLLGGCATAMLWSDEGGRGTKKIVTRNSEITTAFHSTSIDRVCFHFRNDSGKHDAPGLMLKASIDPRHLVYLTKYLGLTPVMQVLAVSARFDPSPPASVGPDQHTTGTANLSVSFAVPQEAGVLPVREDEIRRAGSVGPDPPPSADNVVVKAVAAQAINQRDVKAGEIASVAWLDGTGRIMQDTARVEEGSCEQATAQGLSLLMSATGSGGQAHARVPAGIFCKYNCGILRPCSALGFVTLTNSRTAMLNVHLPQAELGPVNAATSGSASCRGPDWTGLRLSADKAVVSYEENVYEREPKLPLAVRVAATPLSVAFDIVTSPVQLIVAAYILVSSQELIQGMSRSQK